LLAGTRRFGPSAELLINPAARRSARFATADRLGRSLPLDTDRLLPVRVLSRLFRRLFLAGLAEAHAADRLALFGDLDGLRDQRAFAALLAPLRRKNWFVYAKPPFAGPAVVLTYLARYTHRVAISQPADQLRRKRRQVPLQGLSPQRTRALSHHDGGTGEFIRRFLLHVLPKGFHRIRHYGLLASAGCKASIARARELIAMPVPPDPPAEHDNTDQAAGAAADYRPPCPCCGSRMIIVEIFERGVWQKAGAGFALSV
jgi:hypothetical protein